MLKVLNHPLINHKLTTMRRIETGTKDFRENLDEIAGLMAYEITRNLETEDVEITTPICKTTGKQLTKKIVLVPILRAGLGMVDGIRELIPTAKIGHVGLYRNEETLEPCEYYAKFPLELVSATVFILDPMLATGGSASAAISLVKKHGAKDIKLICLVGVQQGIDKVQKDHPDVDIYLAAKDEKLNDIGYIVPGLGDAGDRLFGTK
ncbi:MAG: uracil phosphoribosyltransferase [Erysipelotrichales bacterium]|nr:uracil phosphoribosyltransferase [Bacilli bacterium]MDD4123753.1 uracil phosphoribosyltransferase [Bacilli bacterium]MEA4820705.1 uracil phosphoribosyltransferase [Erysipelotrichales bacterium]